MDKIDGIGSGGFLFRPDVKDKQSEKVEKKSKKTFLGFFQGTRTESQDSPGVFTSEGLRFENEKELHSILASYMDEIHVLGDALSKFPGRANLAAYRQAISNFLKLVTAHSFDTEEHTSNRSVLNQKRYTLVVSINKKLEDLAVGLLQSQSQGLSILSRVEEINGMLFDLMQ